MLRRSALPLSLVALLAACGSTNPFMEIPEIDEEVVDTTDPETSNSLFNFDASSGLVMNDVEYDSINNKLVIYNIPFDGPDGIYDQERTQNGVPVYGSRQTGTTGQVKHYAVYISTDDLEGTAVGDAQWNPDGYGNAGANIRRTTYNLPGGVGEYVYLGTYAGVRQKDELGGLHTVTGDARLVLDVLDPEGDGTVIGAIAGVVTNRQRTTGDGTSRHPLPALYLHEVAFDVDTGAFTEGGASTRDPEGEVRDTGTYEGIIAGAEGEGMGSHVLIDGPSEVQLVTYEVLNWTADVDVPVIDPATGVQAVDPISGDPVFETVTQTGTSSGLNEDNRETVENTVTVGETVGYLAADRFGIPANATITSEDQEEIFTADGNAREIGVIVTEREPDS